VSERRRGAFFSSIPEIQAAVTGRIKALAAHGITLSFHRELPYGSQLDVARDGQTGLINIYHSAKKGLSFVDCSHTALGGDAIAILNDCAPPPSAKASGCPKAEHELETWVGTDESGKGDFFGPLVVAGFYTDKQGARELTALGVRDSKTLQPRQIRSLASTLRERFGDCIEIVAPSNLAYNKLYGSMRNLNRLLAWAHARVIENLIKGKDGRPGHTVDGVVSDRFGDERYIRNALDSMKTLNLIQRPRGESNPAVAAASIIARDCFERRIEELEAKFGCTLPLGAQAHVTEAARHFVRIHGREKLAEVAKLHFKNFKEI